MLKQAVRFSQLEYYFLKHCGIRLTCTFFSWESSLKLMHKEIQKIMKLGYKLSPQQRQKSVFISKTFGIDEKALGWSYNMVVEHLCKESFKSMEVISRLVHERDYEKMLTKQCVQPEQNQDFLKELENFSDTYSRFARCVQNKHSYSTKAHPWYGELNSFAWHAFLVIHLMMHRRQIEKIVKELSVNI